LYSCLHFLDHGSLINSSACATAAVVAEKKQATDRKQPKTTSRKKPARRRPSIKAKAEVQSTTEMKKDSDLQAKEEPLNGHKRSLCNYNLRADLKKPSRFKYCDQDSDEFSCDD